MTRPDAGSPRDLLVDLVSIPSVSGDERAAAERLVEYFAAHGREAWLDEVGNVRAPGDDALLLTSHVDTVPGDIPVEVHEEAGGETLYGRGAVDATGPLCAMAAAAVETGCSFVGVVGEETDSRGARHLVEERDPPEALVNGEPSGWDGLTLGYRGLVGGSYEARVPERHGSRPEPNALQRAMAWWTDVEATLHPDQADDDTGGADGPDGLTKRATATPLTVTGGTTDDGLATEASVDFQVRVPIGGSVDDVRGTLRDLAGWAGDGEWDLAWRQTIPPVRNDLRSPLAGAFRAAIREAGGSPTPKLKTGTADTNLYAAAWDCPILTYGPGDSDLDHTPEEHLPLADFDRAVEVLTAVAARRCRD